MTSQSLESRWDGLLPDPLKPAFQLVDSTHPLALYIGRDTDGNRLLLLVTSERPQMPKQMRAIRIEIYEREDGKWSFLIRLVSPELGHVFALLCSDLIEAARTVPDPSSPVTFVMKRLALWQRLLERTASGLLSESEIRGLAGELVFLLTQAIPSVGLTSAVDSWAGPAAADQDFQGPGGAWEIKTIRADAETVQISSERQLCFSSGTLRLVVIRLDESDPAKGTGGFSLNSLVREARRVLADDVAALECFEGRLVEAKYLMRPEYEGPLFQIGWMKSYEIRDGFPRLVPSMLPDGVCRVRYEVALKACEAFLAETLTNVRPIHGT